MPILMEAKQLTRIAYSDKPLLQGGKTTYLAPVELEEKFGFKYTESLLGEPTEVTDQLSNIDLLTQLKSRTFWLNEKTILDRLQHPLDCFAICKMDDETGHGLFTTKPIVAGTILFLYSGVVENVKTFDEGGSYSYVWGCLNPDELTKIVNAQFTGGLARFMQHLPQDNECYSAYLKQAIRQWAGAQLDESKLNIDELVNKFMQGCKDEELDALKFKNAEVRKQLVTSNVRLYQTIVNKQIVVVCVAQSAIEAGEQLGFSYGQAYWEIANRRPCYFLKNGKQVALDEYDYYADLNKKSAKILIEKKEKPDPIKIYEIAKQNYKAERFALAARCAREALLIFVNSKSQTLENQAYCHSMLASCYRELGKLDCAIQHCEQALKLRKECLKQDDKLIPDTQKKLEGLYALLTKNKKEMGKQLIN